MSPANPGTHYKPLRRPFLQLIKGRVRLPLISSTSRLQSRLHFAVPLKDLLHTHLFKLLRPVHCGLSLMIPLL